MNSLLSFFMILDFIIMLVFCLDITVISAAVVMVIKAEHSGMSLSFTFTNESLISGLG